MPNRREFLKNVAGVSAGAALLGGGITAETLAQATGGGKRRQVMVGGKRVKTVDIHCHVSIPEVSDLLKGTPLDRTGKVNAGGYDDAGLRETRLQEMDREGVDVQALSINTFWYGADRDLATRLIDFQNEKLAALVATRPDRFVAFASVSLQFPELAAQQLEKAMKTWGFRGAGIAGGVPGEEISSPKFDPFWAKAEELQALVFMHPADSAIVTGVNSRVQGSGVLTNVIGNPLETTIFLSHMIFDGTLDRFPNLKLMAAHGGGFLPSYADRSDHGCLVFPKQCNVKLQKHPTEYLKQIYVDTIVFTSEALRHLIAVVGVDRIGIGTDYPYPWETNPVDHVLHTPGLSDADRTAILGGTMCKLLKIPA